MSIGFIFPAAQFAATNTREEQIAHVFSEVQEAFAEIAKGNTENTLLEITDIVHSFETLRRIDPEYTNTLIYNTVEKNSLRGYYVHFNLEEYLNSAYICKSCGCEVSRDDKCVYCGGSMDKPVPALALQIRE